MEESLTEVNWNWIKGQRFKKDGVEYVVHSIIRKYDYRIQEWSPVEVEFKTIFSDDENAKYYMMPYDLFTKKVSYKDAV